MLPTDRVGKYALTAETGQIFVLFLTIFDLSIISVAIPSSALLRNKFANDNNEYNGAASNNSTEIIFVFYLIIASKYWHLYKEQKQTDKNLSCLYHFNRIF